MLKNVQGLSMRHKVLQLMNLQYSDGFGGVLSTLSQRPFAFLNPKNFPKGKKRKKK